MDKLQGGYGTIAMKDQNHDISLVASQPIAIIGMSCNLPGGNETPDAFFDFLLKKGCGIVEIPSDRWSVDVFYDPDPNAISKSVSKWGGFINDIRGFDAGFFGISPREADGMDPQQRLVLQGAVDAMMDAQIPLEEFSRQRTGVFIGISQSEYRTLQEMRITNNETYAGTGYALCISANRISHRLNLSGPSYAVDTACSSSLVAVDQAIANLRTGACDMAVVGGVNAMSHPSPFLAFSKAGMISPTGRVSTFDASANGFVRGEGFGMVILKPLDRAMADGDRVHAVIQGTAANQDGSTTTITAPNQAAQIAMMRSLFDQGNIRPDQVGYVEAHGTGTPIGDPIEAGAIGMVVGQQAVDGPVFVGSCKANIGHLESGAGIAGLIKSALAVKRGVVPPNINFRKPNPHIPFDALNLQVPVRPEEFPQKGDHRFALVNSFGFGGANACALVSSPPERGHNHHPVPAKAVEVEKPSTEMPYIVPVSGASIEALRANAASLLKAMGGKGSLANASLSDIAATLAVKQSHLMHRAVMLVRTRSQFKAALRKVAAGETEGSTFITGQTQPKGKTCFTFSGQGSQWWAMARNLLEHNPTFSDAVNAFDAEFEPVSGWSIRAALLEDKASSRIDDTTVTQPALFAIQSGLAALWKEMGVIPDMVVGHSIGEAAASYVAEGLSLSGAAKFLSKRGAIRDQLGVKGAMAAVGMNHADVAAMLPLDGSLGIAAINGPGSTSISGDYDALHDFVAEFKLAHPDTFIRALTVDTAWHSFHLDAGEQWFRKEMAKIDWSVPHVPFISSVTGLPETRFDTDYGWLNLRRPVNFQGAIETALSLGATRFVELGPAATLAGPTKSTALERGASVSVLNSLSRTGNDFDTMARAAARIFVEGGTLNWLAIAGTPSQHVTLPGYAWCHDTFWQDSEESRRLLYRPVKHPFLGQPERGNGTSWFSEINLRAYPYLKDHRMQSDVIFPAAGYLDTMVAMCRERFGSDKTIELEDAVIHEALFIAPEQEVLFSSVFDPDRGRVQLYSRIRDAEDDWVLRSEGVIRILDIPAPAAKPFDSEMKGLTEVDPAHVYDVDATTGLINYGDAFQTVEALWMTRSKTFARIVLQEAGQATFDRHHLHPTMLDGCLQVLEPSMSLKGVARGRLPGDPICMPVGLGRMRIFANFPSEIIVKADQLSILPGNQTSVGFTVYDTAGKVLLIAEDVRVKMLPSSAKPDQHDEVPAHFVHQVITELRDPPVLAKSPGNWIILAGDADKSASLTKAMRAKGAEVRVIDRATLGQDPGGWLADTAGQEIEEGAIDGFVVTWPLTLPELKTDEDAADMLSRIEPCVKDLISLGELMDFARMGAKGLPKFVFLTAGAYPLPNVPGAHAQILAQMPMAALVRGLATEAPEYRLRTIDVGAENQAAHSAIAEEILADTDETEVVLAQGKRFAPRLQHIEPIDFDPKKLTVDAADCTTNFHLTMKTPGFIDNVGLAEIPLAKIADDDIRIRVMAVGLNFRDVMAVTGLLPKEAEPEPAWQNLGLEFGAIVEAVGKDVTVYKPGDRVMGMGKRSLQKFMSIKASAVAPIPEDISLSQAATIPSAFATAHYALNHVARLRPGEKVFIHVATGGVGMAAVQLAKAAGAEIFATAGNPKKRRLLREMGADNVMNSRSLKFADDVMRITKGRGVDVLLNSLPGDFITKGLDILAPFGRFLEIGKRDVYEDASIGLRALRRNISLNVLDLAAMGEERPDLMKELFSELGQMLTDGVLTPLPFTEFPVAEAADAIRFMSQAKHVGKVVLSFDTPTFTIRRDENRALALSAEASYLVTGGTGGFGLSMADWLSQLGAGRLVLASRSGTVTQPDQKTLQRMQKRGTKIDVVALDVTDAAAVRALVDAYQKTNHPIRGVVHAAAVIQDGFANQLTADMITDVLAPKIAGGWALHKAFADAGITLEFMLGFSSIAQAVGSAGQCNYIAGNAFLDALAHYRRSHGLQGAAINWGVIGDAGFVARNSALSSYLESVGQFGLSAADCGAAMQTALTRDVATFVYSRADWAQVARANPALGASPRLKSVLRSDGDGTTEVRARLLQLSGDDLIEEAEDFIKEEITKVLKVDKKAIQVERPMSELGLDSLSSFELKIRIETALDASIPVSKFLQAPSIRQLSTMLSDEIEGIKRAEAARAMSLSTGDVPGGVEGAKGFRPSNFQQGMLRDFLAPLTSDDARAAMEHFVEEEVPVGVQPEDLQKALAKVQRRHPMLSLVVSEYGELRMGSPELKLVEGPDRGALRPERGELIRVCQNAGILGVRVHAVVGDYYSAVLLLQELLLFSRGETPAKGMGRQVVRLIESNHFDPEDDASVQDRAFWWYALNYTRPKPVHFPERSRALSAPLSGRNHGPAAVIEKYCDSEIQKAEMLRSFAETLRRITNSTGPVLIGVRQTLREVGADAPTIGPFHIEQPLLVPDAKAPPSDVSQFNRILAAADRHRKFDSHAAASEFADFFGETGTTPNQFLFEAVDNLSREAPGHTLHDLWVQVCNLGGSGKIRIIYDTDVINTDTAQNLADMLVQGVAVAELLPS